MKNEEIKIEYTEPKINLETKPDFRDLSGIIPTVTDFPTWVPKKYSECMVIYNSTTTYKFCVYVSNVWRTVNLS